LQRHRDPGVRRAALKASVAVDASDFVASLIAVRQQTDG
jgi:hypothetical protein